MYFAVLNSLICSGSLSLVWTIVIGCRQNRRPKSILQLVSVIDSSCARLEKLETAFINVHETVGESIDKKKAMGRERG